MSDTISFRCIHAGKNRLVPSNIVKDGQRLKRNCINCGLLWLHAAGACREYESEFTLRPVQKGGAE